MARRRRTSRRKPVRRNKLSTKKKAALGGLAVAGAAGLYFLLKSSPASAQDTVGPGLPGGGAPGGGGATGPSVATCQILARELVTARGAARPDATQMAKKEAALRACLSAAEEGGAEVPPFLGRLSEGDEDYLAINTLFEEYRNTTWDDPLKRNNIRGQMLLKGDSMATKYAAAVEAAANDLEVHGARQSIVRAFEAAMTQRLCHLHADNPTIGRGCGRAAVNEPHPNDKARDIKIRVIDKLVPAHERAVAKLGGAGRERIDRGSSNFLAILLRPCAALNTHINAQFNHYKRTEYSDAFKRNNTRQSLLASGASLASCLQANLDAAKRYRNTAAAAAAATLAESALQASIHRWVCYKNDQTGCGRFVVNEDHGNTKAAQEKSRVMDPLFVVFDKIAAYLSASHPQFRTKAAALRSQLCGSMKTRIDSQFNHYKRTEYSDALKRNNTRGSMLAMGAEMAACARQAYVQAAGKKAALLAVSASVMPALDAAVTRKICYVMGASGCGRFAVNEPHGNDKARDVQTRVITPLSAVARDVAAALARLGDTAPDVRLAQILTRECVTYRNFADQKFREYKTVTYTDAVRRNNLRMTVLAYGRKSVACFGALRPATAAGRRVVRDLIMTGVHQSQARANCYNAGTAGCGRFALNEDEGRTKVRQEIDSVGQPLANLVSSSSLRGLGVDDTSASNAPLYLLGAAGLAALVYLNQ